MPSSVEVDIESGHIVHPSPTSTERRAWPSPQIEAWTSCLSSRGAYDAAVKPIEDYPAGYPRFSALIASHPSFHVCRRFSTLRTRLLLLKQDRLSLLERKLETIDREEVAELSLGSSRRDRNDARLSVLTEIHDALEDYDTFLERHHRAFSFESAPRRAVSNLKNWIDGTGCLARDETAYLNHSEDLISATVPEDNAMTCLEALVEHSCIYFHKHFLRGRAARRPHSCPGISRDPNVHIIPASTTRQAKRILIALFITILLLGPVIVCNFIHSLSPRLVIVTIATASFVTILSSLTKANTVELMVSGATYTTVLVVFISNMDGIS